MKNDRLDDEGNEFYPPASPPAQEPCNCEHLNHFPEEWSTGSGEVALVPAHAYMKVPAGDQRAQFVGAICDWCATHCLSEYLI